MDVKLLKFILTTFNREFLNLYPANKLSVFRSSDIAEYIFPEK